MDNLIFDPSLVLYLPLDELDGSSFMSRDACGHLCTNNGSTWTPEGRSFDGVDDYINCGHDSSLSMAGDFTVEVWFKRATTGSFQEQLVSKFGYEPSSKSNYEIHFYEAGTPNILYARWTYDGGNWQVLSFREETVADIWYCAVLVHTGNKKKTYFNGEYKNQITIPGTLDTIPGIDLNIGQRNYGSERFHGLIGEVRIYNRALTSIEIQHHYLATEWRYR